jgi:hypothetical protein
MTKSAAILFKPQTAYRVRWNMNPDTPLPQEEPAGQNPPDGAIINYYLEEKVNDIKLQITDTRGNIIREYSNKDTLYKIPVVNIPLYWIRPQQLLSAEAGSHRFTWDMHYAPRNVPASYPISAIYNNTAPVETSPWALPGIYSVKLIIGDRVYKQTFNLIMDPRVKTGKKELQLQHDLSLMCYYNTLECMKAAKMLEGKMDSISIRSLRAYSKMSDSFREIQGSLQESDMPPTTQMILAARKAEGEFKEIMKK